MRHAWREIAWYVNGLWLPLFIASVLLFLAGWLFIFGFVLFDAQHPWRWLNPGPSNGTALERLQLLLRNRGLGWLLGTWLAAFLFVLLWSLASPTLCEKPGMKCGDGKGRKAAHGMPAEERFAAGRQ